MGGLYVLTIYSHKFLLSLPAFSHMRPLLFTRFNVNPSMNTNHMPGKMCNGITYPFPNFTGATVEVWESISNFFPYFIMNVFTYPPAIKFDPCLYKGSLGHSQAKTFCTHNGSIHYWMKYLSYIVNVIAVGDLATHCTSNHSVSNRCAIWRNRIRNPK